MATLRGLRLSIEIIFGEFWVILAYVVVSVVNDRWRIGERVGGEMRRMYKGGELGARWNHFGELIPCRYKSP